VRASQAVVCCQGIMAQAGFNETLKWTMGLINSAGKYLTAETFQFKLTANGTSMRKKQIFTLERAGDNIALKSCLGRYLSK